MEKRDLIWTNDFVKVSTVNKVANGIQETIITLDNGSDLELPKPSAEEMLHLYKDTIILALTGRMSNCVNELVNAEKKAVRAESSWIFLDSKECTHVFNYKSYEAMQEAVKLAKAERFSEFTANMWDQVVKGLSRVHKKYSIKPYPFDTMLDYAMNQYATKMHELYSK